LVSVTYQLNLDYYLLLLFQLSFKLGNPSIFFSGHIRNHALPMLVSLTLCIVNSLRLIMPSLRTHTFYFLKFRRCRHMAVCCYCFAHKGHLPCAKYTTPHTAFNIQTY